MDFTINLRKKVKDKPKNLKRTEGNSINQREVTIEEKFCSVLQQIVPILQFVEGTCQNQVE